MMYNLFKLCNMNNTLTMRHEYKIGEYSDTKPQLSARQKRSSTRQFIFFTVNTFLDSYSKSLWKIFIHAQTRETSTVDHSHLFQVVAISRIRTQLQVFLFDYSGSIVTTMLRNLRDLVVNILTQIFYPASDLFKFYTFNQLIWPIT
jgi:hypothetical protein